MSLELIDLRLNVTAETACVLEAERRATGQELQVTAREAGASVSELARKHGVVVETIYKRLRRASRQDMVPGSSVFALAGTSLVTRLGRVGSGS